MTEQEVQAFCANNGISVSPVGQPLHVVDPTELPASVRKFVNDDGTHKGDDTPEAEDESSGESGDGSDTDVATASKTPTKARSKAAKKGRK